MSENDRMISDEAVEAAAKVIALSTGHIMESDWEWEHLPKEHYYKTARAALDAAAPHMLAAAWDEGRKHGARYPYGQRGLGTDDNPYRSQP